MEITRITSDSEFSLFNVLKEILIFYLKCFLLFYAYKYSRKYFRVALVTSKRVLGLGLINEIINGFFAFIYSVIIVYLLNLLSLISIREHVFFIWRNLFWTDSNIRDLNSFTKFYCEDNNYNKNNFYAEEEFKEYEPDYKVTVDETVSQIFNNSIKNLCNGHKFLESGNIETFLVIAIIGCEMISVIKLLLTNNIQNGRNNSDQEEDGLSKIPSFFIKVYCFFLFVYLITLYYFTYSNYFKIKIAQDNLKVNVTYHQNYEYSVEDYLDKDNQTTQYEQVQSEDESRINVWTIIKIIFEILLEAL